MNASLSENIFMIIFPNFGNERKSIAYLGVLCYTVTCNGMTTKPIFSRLKIWQIGLEMTKKTLEMFIISIGITCDHYLWLFNIQITILMKRELKISQIFAKAYFQRKISCFYKAFMKKIYITYKSTSNKLSNDGLHLPYCKS